MPLLEYTKKDVLRSKLVEPGWYTLVINDYGFGINKKKDGNNHTFDFLIGDPGSFEGVPIRKVFSDKAISRIFPLLEALGFNIEEGGGSIKLDAPNLNGRKVQGKVVTGINKENNDEPFNDIVEYRAAA